MSRLFLNRMHRQFGFPMFLLRDADIGGIINCNLLRCGNQILSYNKYITIPLSCTGTCYEAGELQPNGYGGRPLRKRNKTIATNVFSSYRKWKHPYNVSITNHIRLMMELNRKTSSSRVPPEKSYNQMMNILTLAKSKKVILTANVSDGQQFIDKTKLIEFDMETEMFKWHSNMLKFFIEIPTQVFNILSNALNKQYENILDMLPIQLMFSTIVPTYFNDPTTSSSASASAIAITNRNDMQFHRKSEGMYVIITYNAKKVMHNFLCK